MGSMSVLRVEPGRFFGPTLRLDSDGLGETPRQANTQGRSMFCLQMDRTIHTRETWIS